MPARIAICLLDENITQIDPSLMGGKPLLKVQLNTAIKDVELYIKTSNPITPDWISIIQSFSNVKASDVETASSGAILFLKIQDRILACCFGTSVANIDKDNIVRDFGLAVAFNRIPNKNYKGIETFTLTENVITNNRNAARPSTQNTFNLDTYLETITQLSGKYFANSRNILIKGKEFFSILAPENLTDIKKLCTDLLAEYNKTVKDKRFKELTSVAKVKATKLLDFLNDKLCKELNKKSLAIYLIDYQFNEAMSSYSLTPTGNKLTELNIDDLYQSLNSGQGFTLPYMKTRRITVYDSNDQDIDTWPLYKCLYVQFTLNIGTYILYKGNWYEVQKRYLKDLKDYITTHEINSTKLKLPAWNGTQKEGAYNIAAASAIKGQCWDKTLYTHPDFSYGIEFCDILLPKYVIHVKKLSSSSLNSHLLMQTYVSAQLLTSDIAIRPWIKKEAIEKFNGDIFLDAKNRFIASPVKYLIVLMRGTNSKKLIDSMPFFSLITFNMMIRRILGLGFEVEVCAV